MIDTSKPRSPGWWLARLVGRLGEERQRFDILESYVDGRNVIPAYADGAVRDAARRLLRMSGTNFAELICGAVSDRMDPVGFRTGAVSDDAGDAEAWRIWQANALDADHAVLDTTVLSLSRAAVIVGGYDEGLEAPLITPEDPREVIVECDPARRRKVIAAAKVYCDEVAGLDVAYLYLPGFVLRAVRETQQGVAASTVEGWTWDGVPQALPAKVVPVVPFAYRPKLRGLPVAEFEPYIPILDRLNYTILNQLETMTMQAFRQRAIKGVPQKNPDGTEVDYDELFRQGPGVIWTLPATAELWESGVIDLTPILESRKADVRDLAAVSRTPMSYLFPDAAQGSAEGAALTREGLIFKTNRAIGQASESYEDVMSLAFLFAGDAQRASRTDMQVIWAPPDRYTLAEKALASSQAIGISRRTMQEQIWQLTPQEISRDEGYAAAEAATEPPSPELTAPAA